MAIVMPWEIPVSQTQNKVPTTTSSVFPSSMDDIGNWLMSWIPNATNYYEQQFKNSLEGSNMLMGLGMGNFANNMNQLAGLNDSLSGMLMGARQQGLGNMAQGNSAYQGLLSSAINAGSKAGQKLDFSKYLANIDSGSVNPSIDAMLKGIQSNQFGLAEDAISRATNNAMRNSNQQMALRGLGGSTSAQNAQRDIAAQQAEALRDASREAAASYGQNRLGYPFKQLSAAISAQTPSAQNDQTMASLFMKGGSDLANLFQNTADYMYNSASDAYKNMMGMSSQIANMPLDYFKMAQALPSNSLAGREGYMSTLMSVWKSLMDQQIAQAQIDAQSEDDNPLSWLFG